MIFLANLINLAQIKGGLTLKNTLEAIDKAYPASKVTTVNEYSVYKKAEDGETADAEGYALDAEGKRIVEKTEKYTAQELLTELKTSMDKLVGGGSSGSIQSQIEKSVKTITDRKLNDYVRIWIAGYNDLNDIDFFKLDNLTSQKIVAQEKVELPDDLDEVRLSGSEKAKIMLDMPYLVFRYNNEPVVDEFKKNIYVTFTKVTVGDKEKITASMSGVPCTFKQEKEIKEVTDEALTINSDKQTLVLENKYIDTSTLVIKDSEGNIVNPSKYYVKAIGGQINFRKEQKADSTFTASYSYSTFKETTTKHPNNPLKHVITDDDPTGTWKGAWYKIYPIETTTFGELDINYLLDNTEMNNVAMSNAIHALERELVEETDIISQIVSAVGDSAIQTALQNITESLTERIEVLEKKVKTLESWAIDTFVAEENQTEFKLSKVPTSKPVDCYINGVKYQESTYFVIDRDTKGTDGNEGYKPVATWQFTDKQGGFDLNDKFEVVFEYLVDNDKDLYVAPKSTLVPSEDV